VFRVVVSPVLGVLVVSWLGLVLLLRVRVP
jgi:hypothetical protein